MKRYCAGILGLLLFCGNGALIYAQETCLGDILPEKQVYAVFSDIMLDYIIRKGTLLGDIPKEYVDAPQKTLAKNYEHSLKQEIEGTHILKKDLEVNTKEGKRYRIREGTIFKYELPDGNYKVIIRKGSPLIKQAGPAPQKYVLNEDIPTEIIPPKNYRVLLTVDGQTEVERIPGTSSSGTTLENVDAKWVPVGGYLTFVVSKSGFKFGEAQIQVCLRKYDQSEQRKWLPIPPKEVELKEVQIGKARLKIRIPNNTEIGGAILPQQIELLVVAHGPGGNVAEVLSQEFSISSRPLAIISWILAIVIPWLIFALFNGPKPREQNKPSRFNPIWIISGKYGGASLSLAQILLWTVLIFSASFYVLVVSGKLLDITGEVLTLLGIAGGASLIAKFTASVKEERGRAIVETQPRDPKWIDIFQTEGRPDLSKGQMALFTTLAAFFVTGKIFSTLEFPILPSGLLTLIGISNGVYLGAKAVSTTAFEKLADKKDELTKAQEELNRRKAEAVEAAKNQEKAKEEKNAASTTLQSIDNKLKTEQDTGQKQNLGELYEKEKAAAQEADRRLEEAVRKNSKAENAQRSAESKVKELEREINTLKDEASRQG